MAHAGHGTISVTIASPGAEPVHVAVRRDLSAPSPAEAVYDTPFSYAYTGRHDGGALSAGRTDNMYGHVLDALLECKLEVDSHMKRLVAAEVGLGSSRPASDAAAHSGPKRKRARREGDGGASGGASGAVDTVADEAEDDGDAAEQEDGDGEEEEGSAATTSASGTAAVMDSS